MGVAAIGTQLLLDPRVCAVQPCVRCGWCECAGLDRNGARGSEQIYLDCGVDAAQAAWVGAQRWPVTGPRDMRDVSSASVEDVGGKEQLVDLACADGVEVAEHHGGMTQRFSEL